MRQEPFSGLGHSARAVPVCFAWCRGYRMTESGLQRLAFNLLLALTLYVALTGGA
jgi:hypothetical protein